ncbi:MAG TPA: ABC transporter substrate-binding protein [Hyphomicrobiales bacterium]|nr:ABC transporter substrate-binding protein [Hyphomicrobiales bacterium]
MKGFVKAALGAAFVLAGIGISHAEDMTPGQQALYAKAKVEGQVNLWAPIKGAIDWIPGEFAKRFPGIKINVVGDLRGATKIISEARAGSPTCDVWTTSIGNMLTVQQRGLLAKTDWTVTNIPKEDIFFDGEGAAIYNFVYGILYAKDHVKEADLPEKWSDLTDPKWKGKLVADDFLLPRLMGFLALDWGADKTEQWAKSLLGEQKMAIATLGPIQAFLRSGERVIEVGGSAELAHLDSEAGIPTGYRLLHLAPAGQFVSAVVKGAPHPNAAALLATWLATDEAKALSAEHNHTMDVRPDSKDPVMKEIKARAIKVILEAPENIEKRDALYKRFSPMVRGQ